MSGTSQDVDRKTTKEQEIMLKFLRKNSDGLATGLVVSSILIMFTMAFKADIVYPALITLVLAMIAAILKPVNPNRSSNRRIK